VPANSRTDVPRPSQYGFKDYEELIIPTKDGEKLSAFYIRGPRGSKNSKVTVLFCKPHKMLLSEHSSQTTVG
jgi:hypothetical protein